MFNTLKHLNVYMSCGSRTAMFDTLKHLSGLYDLWFYNRSFFGFLKHKMRMKQSH